MRARLSLLTILAYSCFWSASAWASDTRLALDFRAELSQANAEFEDAQRLQTENPDRARLLFRAAAQRFKSLVAAGIENGALEYNLGNCYLQAGDLGRAILHYRRAQRLIPGDPLLADNLREALSRRVTVIPSSRAGEFFRSVFFWHYETTVSGRMKTSLVFYLAFWLLWTLRSWFSRRWISIGAAACGMVALFAGASVMIGHWQDRHASAGILVGLDVAVLKGPGSGYQRQFEQPLQSGVEFTLRERRGNWWNIELPDGQTGWIDSSSAELVVAEKAAERS